LEHGSEITQSEITLKHQKTGKKYDGNIMTILFRDCHGIGVEEIMKSAIQISRSHGSRHSNYRYVPRISTQKYGAKSSKNVTVIS
jgi:hypothetical protein